MRDTEVNGRSSNKVLWIVLGAVGGVLFLGVLACGGLIYLLARGVQSVKE